MRQLLLALALVLAAPAAAQAQAQAQDIEVDVELMLMVDLSRSMSPREIEIQRQGYRAALTSPEVLAAIGGGMLGRIAVSYVEWSGSASQRTVVPWTLIESPEDAARVASRIVPMGGLETVGTSISGALFVGAARFRDNGFQGLRRVIDISGDGPNNNGGPVTAARDAVTAKGITINGLPLMTREGLGSAWHLEDLDQYYLNCVVGGPGAFVIPVLDWASFADAVRRKLVLEIAGLPPQPDPGERIVPATGYDCLIGEKLWERYRNYWENL
ncbi:MAG: DUF1194 domain-containing protein [Paracoccaceae bacterium]